MYFKKNVMGINRNNYENFFLLYLDGELSQDDKTSVEKFLSENIDLQKEFSVLKNLRFTPDEIYFDEKQLLLRTEGKRRVLPVSWLRMTAVFLLVITGAWLIWMFRNQTKSDHVVMENHVSVLKSSPDEPVVADHKKTTESFIHAKNENWKTMRKKDPGNVYISKTETSAVDSAEEIAEIKKSTIKLKPETTEIYPPAETRQISTSEIKKSSPLVAATTVPPVDANPINSVSQADQSEDVSVSILSLSTKNKPVTGFFKKILNNTNSAKSGRTVNVSVLQISY
jgi:hypothetical protein